MMSLVIVLLDL